MQLIAQAAALGQGSEIFVLDMGEQVYIADLAAELVRFSGLEPGHDVEIVFTGPRPGEKLSEELFAQGEEPGPTQHEKILVAQGNNTWDSETLRDHVRELEALAREGDAGRIIAKLREVVPEYRPDGQ